LVKFIPSYFIIFDVFINGTVFLISLSDGLLLMYKSAKDFYIFIWFFFYIKSCLDDILQYEFNLPFITYMNFKGKFFSVNVVVIVLTHSSDFPHHSQLCQWK